MEGESLFNDASSIVLFQIFFEMVRWPVHSCIMSCNGARQPLTDCEMQVKKINQGRPAMDGSALDQAREILMKICVLGGGVRQRADRP